MRSTRARNIVWVDTSLYKMHTLSAGSNLQSQSITCRTCVSRQHAYIAWRFSHLNCQATAGDGTSSNVPVGNLGVSMSTGQSEQAHATASASVNEQGTTSLRRSRRQRLESTVSSSPVPQKSDGMPLASIFGVGLVAAASILFVLYRQYFTNTARTAVAGVAGIPQAISQVGCQTDQAALDLCLL